jgi:two-component system cell cycle response regulator DivK
METRGFAVMEASDGAEGIRLAKRLKPDLILMDTNLPHVDGLMATRIIRESWNTAEMPIVFISGHSQPEKRAAALAAGGNAYLVKPIVLSQLELVVESQLANMKAAIGA